MFALNLNFCAEVNRRPTGCEVTRLHPVMFTRSSSRVMKMMECIGYLQFEAVLVFGSRDWDYLLIWDDQCDGTYYTNVFT